jgi:hypothetical protein
MIGRLTEIARCYGMEMNVEKCKVMRISRKLSPLQIMVDQKQLDYGEYFNCLGKMIKILQAVHVKLNPGLPWENQYSTKRRFFSPEN